MSKAIRNLSNWRPNEEEWDRLFEEIKNQSDRGAGIVAGSFLDATLQLALHSYFAAEPARELLENIGGALSTFSSRIIVGAALGLYSPAIRKRIDTIRHIRNAFAHTLKPIGFDEPAIADACAGLPLLDVRGSTPPVPTDWSDARQRYVGTCYRHGHDLVGLAIKYGGREITVEIDENGD
ncbi:MAG: hypothetical protein QM773_03650 [Hyphomonadaceae bacterium]